MQHEKDCSHTSPSSCFLYSSAIILIKILDQLIPTHFSLTQGLRSTLIRFCPVFHLKSASQKGPTVKFWCQSLRYLTELCWRQREKTTGIGHRMRFFYILFIYNHLYMLRYGETLTSSFLRKPIHHHSSSKVLISFWTGISKSSLSGLTRPAFTFHLSCLASSEINLPGDNIL